MPFLTPWESSPIDYRNKGTLILTSLLEDLEMFVCVLPRVLFVRVGEVGVGTAYVERSFAGTRLGLVGNMCLIGAPGLTRSQV